MRRAFGAHMKCVWLACLLAGSLFASAQDPEANVNSRYTVETVIVSGDGWSTNLASDRDDKISFGLRREFVALIGAKLNPSALDDLGRRLRKEFQARAVTHRLLRGDNPDTVRVVFEVSLRPTRFDVSVPKFLYNAKQGWSGTVEGTATVHHNAFTLGLVSDGDELVERYAGFLVRYENSHLGTDRVHFRFDYDNYHEQWNSATRDQLAPDASSPVDTAEIYRSRENYAPVVSFVIARPLTVSVGASFEQFENQFPAATPEAANALIATLRYQTRMEDSENRQDLDAGYDLRAATRVLASDFVYARHHGEVRYILTHGKHVLTDDFQAGLIAGRAPLFERYVAGNSSILRGWNKFEIDPLGGNRIIANSVEYRYGIFQIFYDTGAIWDSGQPAVARHSLGAGVRQNAFFLAVAFPVRESRADPIFMVGMNY